MKASLIFSLPLSTLAIAAAAPKVEERQYFGFSDLEAPLDPTCVAGIPGITCLGGPIDPSIILLDLIGCPGTVQTQAEACVIT